MFLFPVVYILSFCSSLYHLIHKRTGDILLFFICGLPIYISTLSVVNMYGFPGLVPVLQAFKEILVVLALGISLYMYKEKIRLHTIDKLVLAFFIYSFIYILLPLGRFGFFEKLLAFKSLSFFVLVYFTGRFCDLRTVSVNKYFRIICAVIIVASAVLLYEVITYQHLQTFTGYAEYNYRFFQQEPSGNFGLTWTFEVNDIGRSSAKRFASIFANPLEFAAATVLTVSILIALYTKDNGKIKTDPFGLLVLASSAIAIFFALSRASFVSYFLVIYMYAFLTGKRLLIRYIHILFILALLYVIFLVNKDVRGFIIDTLNFNNLSSLGHLVEWLDGIQSMIANPLGVGLGESGRIAGATGENIGGESQLIILGVQTGVISLILYIAIYIMLIRQAYARFTRSRGSERKLSLGLLLMKTGFIISVITTNFESYIYLSYVSWFLSGVFVAMLMRNRTIPTKLIHSAATF